MDNKLAKLGVAVSFFRCLAMHEEPTTVVIQRYLDALPGDAAAEPAVRELLERAVGRLRLLCATLLHKSYPRLARPPVNLETDELLGASWPGCSRPCGRPARRRCGNSSGLATQHMRWQLNDLARRLDEQPAAEALSDDGSLTGRGRPLIRGLVCGLMTALGGLGHTLPYLIPHFDLATVIAVVVVLMEQGAIAYIRHHFMDTPLTAALFQVVVGGVLVFVTGILIGSS